MTNNRIQHFVGQVLESPKRRVGLALIASFGIPVIAGVLIWLHARDQVLQSMMLHNFFFIVTCATAFYLAYASYLSFLRTRASDAFFTTLAFFTMGVVFFAHALSVPGVWFVNEEYFDITEHYGFFLGAVLFLPLSFTPVTHAMLYELRRYIFGGVAVVVGAWLGLTMSLTPFQEFLYRYMSVVTSLTTLLFLSTLVVTVRKYVRTAETTLLLQISGFALLSIIGVTPFFYQEWDLLWWMDYALVVISLLLFLMSVVVGRTQRVFTQSGAQKVLLHIGVKLFIAFAVVGLVPLLILAFITNQNTRAVIVASTENTITRLAESAESQVYEYLDSIEIQARDFASDGLIRSTLVSIEAGNTAGKKILDRHLITNKLPINPMIEEVRVLDTHGVIVASTNSAEIGNDKSHTSSFMEGIKGVSIGLLEEGEFATNVGLIVTVPITDSGTGTIIGAISNVYHTGKIEDILTGRFQASRGAISAFAGQSENLETYLVDSHKRMFVHPVQAHRLNTMPMIVDTPPVQTCLEKHAELYGAQYENYQGDTVLGTSMCFVSLGWTLVVEQQLTAAFQPVTDAQNNANLVVSIAGLITFLGALFISAMFSRPLRALTKSAEALGRGDFTKRARIQTGDEIELLGDAFNTATEKLKAAQHELEANLHERERAAKQLTAQNEDLTKTKRAMTNLLEDVEEDKRKIAESKALDDAILTGAAEGIVAVDSAGHFLLFNAEAKRLLGRGPQEVPPEAWPQAYGIYHPTEDRLAKFNEIKAFSVLRGETVVGDKVRIRRPDGSEVVLRINASPVRLDGATFGAVLSFSDVTKEEEIDKAKTEFVSLASHQLRTPLSAINWYAEMLLAGDAGRVSKQQKEYLHEIYAGNQRMVELVNALLNVSRLELGTFTVEPELVDVAELVASVIDEEKPAVEGKNLTLTSTLAPKLPKLSADPRLLRIVLQNLVSNAVKYTPEKGTITVTVAVDTKAKTMNFTVQDTGMGIPENQQEKIFTKLFRADNVRATDTEGTGLGLYIVKSVVEHSGGAIHFESKENQGTTFFVTLPLTGMKKKEGTRKLG